MQSKEHPSAEQTPTSAKITRRRPGRNEQVSPHLINLLRNLTVSGSSVQPYNEWDAPASHDDLTAVRGIAFSLVLCILFWAGVSGAAWVVLH